MWPGGILQDTDPLGIADHPVGVAQVNNLPGGIRSLHRDAVRVEDGLHDGGIVQAGGRQHAGVGDVDAAQVVEA